MKSLKKYFWVLILLVLIFSFSLSCSRNLPKSDNLKSCNKIKVITTIFPLYDIAKNVGGNRVTVKNLLPPGSSPHTYEPTTEDSMDIEDSDIIFKLGLSLDDWMDRVVKSTGQKKKLFVISQGVETIPLNGFCSKHHGHCSHKAGGVNPHVWMDPLKMVKMAQGVRDIYIKISPRYKKVFDRNYELYAKKLKDLDKEYKETLSKYKKKDFITYHSFLDYQARRYGINQVAVIADFPGKDPSPHHIIDIIKVLKAKNVKVVFVEPQFSPKASEAVAREIKGRIIAIDPIGSPADPKRDSYIKNMKMNLKALERAFKEEN